MVTLKDVAKEAGLTVGTVSRVLNNRGYISDDAREKVYSAMKKLNYRPNELARSLQGKGTNTIGLIVPHIRHPYFAEMISNIENQAYKKGYRILLCNSQSIEEKEKEYIDICTGNRVAGIILCSGTVSVGELEGSRVDAGTCSTWETSTASPCRQTSGQRGSVRSVKRGGSPSARCLRRRHSTMTWITIRSLRQRCWSTRRRTGSL